MKVLVTGGAGFIGSHVVDALLDRGAQVRVVDSLEPSVHGAVAGDGGAGLAVDPRAELIVGDLCDPAVARRAVDGVDAVCHQSAKVGLGVDFGDVTGYVAGNDLATAVLLRALWRNGFGGRLVLASSMVVYGEGLGRCPVHGVVPPAARRDADLGAGRWEPGCAVGEGTPDECREFVAWIAVEESAPTDPRNVYAATKLHQEHLCS
ncbi:MAG: NAD(P)-dependent oxidoreductase, partial [Actinobacteria bacterium]|nr:NAD(P)-dependent oxidoreductase [Actinomycetota bacterium]